MLISDLKSYIKSKKAVSATDLTLKFSLDLDSLELPIKILIDKGLIYVGKSNSIDSGAPKCKGCPMTCRPKEVDDCESSAPFNIYTWKES